MNYGKTERLNVVKTDHYITLLLHSEWHGLPVTPHQQISWEKFTRQKKQLSWRERTDSLKSIISFPANTPDLCQVIQYSAHVRLWQGNTFSALHYTSYLKYEKINHVEMKFKASTWAFSGSFWEECSISKSLWRDLTWPSSMYGKYYWV